MNKWPKQEQINEILEELKSRLDTQSLPKNATEKDRIKYSLCEEFVKYMNEKELSQRQLAEKMGINESLVSKIVHYHFNEFSLDRLYDFLKLIHPSYTLRVVRKNEAA